MKRILIILFLLISLSSYSQVNNKLKEIIGIYTIELKLNTKETKKMTSIMESYNGKFSKKDITPNVFNSTLKKQTLEIYELLTKEQFTLYKALRSKHQPELSYRFN